MATLLRQNNNLPAERTRGGQLGNVNAMRVKPFERALRQFLQEKPKVLPTLIKKLVSEALKGEQWAAKEIREMLDGKAVQPIAGIFEVSPTSSDPQAVQSRLAQLVLGALERPQDEPALDTGHILEHAAGVDAGPDRAPAGGVAQDDGGGAQGAAGPGGAAGDSPSRSAGEL